MKDKINAWLKDLKGKLGNYGFWMSLGGAFVYLLQVCGVKIDQPVAEAIINAVCGVLIILGIINNPNEGKFY